MSVSLIKWSGENSNLRIALPLKKPYMSDSKQKILFLSEFFYPSQNSTAYYISKIASVVAADCDRQVHVYCASPAKENDETFSSRKNLTIHRIDKGKGNKNNLLLRPLKFVRITLKFCFVIIFKAKSNDVLFAVTNPAFIIPICSILKGVFHYKYILLAYDIFPENLIAAGLMKKKHILYKLSKYLFDWSYRKADYVISIGRDMSKILQQKGIREDHIVLIQNWADTEKVKYSPKTDNQIIKQYHLENKRVFMFAGNFGRVQGISELLDVIDHVSADNAAFLFVGDGAMREVIIEYQKAHPQKVVICHPYLPMDQQNIFLNACDVAIVTLNEKMFGLGVPSKSYYSLASGHPILFIGDEHSEVAQMLQEGQCGWQTSFKKIETCAKLFDSICSLDQEIIERIGCAARKYLQSSFSEQIALKKYSQLFRRIQR